MQAVVRPDAKDLARSLTISERLWSGPSPASKTHWRAGSILAQKPARDLALGATSKPVPAVRALPRKTLCEYIANQVGTPRIERVAQALTLLLQSHG